jgi:glycosyltransferase involved in cell wall biosynthesis
MRQTRIKISIIIPVYNTAEYLERCVNSVLTQDYKNIEIILVDDGSSDGSSKICEDYALSDTRIKVIHQSNLGAATARNNGIKISTGDYIMFLDSDDFWTENCLDSIVKQLKNGDENVEVLFLKVAKYYNSSKVGNFVGYEFKDYDRNKLLEYIAGQNKVAVSACLKVIKRDLITKENIYFQNDLLAEDIDWFFNLISSANKFSTYDGDFYYYQIQDNSASHNTSEKRIKDYLYILNKWINYTKKNVVDDEKKYYYNMIGYEYEVLLATFYNFSNEIRSKFLTRLEELFWLLDYRKGNRSTLMKFLKSVIGFKNTCILLNFYLNHRRR